MPTINSLRFGYGPQLTSTAHYETWSIGSSGYLVSFDDAAVYIDHAFVKMNNNGVIQGAEDGVTWVGAAGFLSNTGTIATTSTSHLHSAVNLASGLAAGQGATFENRKLVSALDAVAVSVAQNGSNVVNASEIEGGTGIRLTGSAGDTKINNWGSITASGNDSAKGDITYGHAIYSGARNTNIRNEAKEDTMGEIIATGGGDAIVFDLFGQGSSVYNEGLIQSTDGIAINAYGINGVRGTQGITVINTSKGTIEGKDTAILGSIDNDTIVAFGNIIGDIRTSFGDDRIYLKKAMHDGDIYGGGGDDDITAAADTGSVYGGSGDDYVLGGVNTFLIKGGSGDDTLIGGLNAYTIDGGTGDDTITTSIGTRKAYGGAGDDEITMNGIAGQAYGGAGDDTMFGGVSPTGSTLYGGTGTDTITGGDHDDRLYGGTDDDMITGGLGDDFLYGGAGDDLLEGGDGTDGILTGDGFDIAYGGGGNDVLLGGNVGGSDSLFGGDGDDILAAANGSDNSLSGGMGDDTIYTGNDTTSDNVNGNLGDDTIIIRNVGDRVSGGGGADTFEFQLAADTGRTLIRDFTLGDDTMDLSAYSALLSDFADLQSLMTSYSAGTRITLDTGSAVHTINIIGLDVEDFTATDFIL